MSEKPDKRFLSQVIKVNINRDKWRGYYTSKMWSEESGTYLFIPKTHNPSLIMRKIDKSQLKGIPQNCPGHQKQGKSVISYNGK